MKRGELIRLALIYAEMDRRAMAASDPDSENGRKALELALDFYGYRVKRFGRTAMEADLDSAKTISLEEIMTADSAAAGKEKKR